MLIKYIILGIIQGLTETLPVSSSGHLLIFRTLLNLNVDFDTIAILTNFGSLVAIVVLFWKDIVELISGFFKYLGGKKKEYKDKYNYCLLIVLGCIPAGIMGLVFSYFDVLDKISNNVKIVGVSLLVTSVMLFMVRNFKGKKLDNDITAKDALIIGSFQILGLLPGISRSGSTIVGGMNRKLKRDTAFKYSFMLYIPLSICALILEVKDLILDKALILHYSIAIFVSFIVTLLVTKWFRKVVNEGKLIYFSIYCLIVGLLVVLLL